MHISRWHLVSRVLIVLASTFRVNLLLTEKRLEVRSMSYSLKSKKQIMMMTLMAMTIWQ